ncbi:MAG TPA: hypothetical protein VGN20_27625 [Mucilaginibacter sp.]|jgi:alkaline phosphatase
MKKIFGVIFFFTSLLNIKIAANAQIKTYTVADAHSHNDYNNSMPFYRAYNKGFGSIEVDVFAVNRQLMVAHDAKYIVANRSLKILYIDPLLKKFKTDTIRQLRLLIEIKEDYKAVLSLVIKELKPLKQYFSYPNHPGRLSIVMTGAVPPANELWNYPDWITFDVDHLNGFTPHEWEKIELVSFPFAKYVKWWNGTRVLTPDEIRKLRGSIDSVHQAGRKIRFWETPDTKTSWLTLMKLGVDVIGTDAIEELGDFLNDKAREE